MRFDATYPQLEQHQPQEFPSVFLWRLTDLGSYHLGMANFEITMTDQTVQRVTAAEAYQQEGPMTTFFTSESNGGRLDSWSVRLASFRSADVFMIRRCEVGAEQRHLGLVGAAD